MKLYSRYYNWYLHKSPFTLYSIYSEEFTTTDCSKSLLIWTVTSSPAVLWSDACDCPREPQFMMDNITDQTHVCLPPEFEFARQCLICCFNLMLKALAFIVMLKNIWESNEGKWYTHPRIFNFWSQTLDVHPLHPQRSSCLLSWANIPDTETHTWSLPHSFFFYFPLHLSSAAPRLVSFNPVMSSSASVTEYNHLCALIQPRRKMLCQFEQGGRESEREGGREK